MSRDRAGAYADGIRQGAPTAIQIADRFHLVKNAGDVLERVVQRHHEELRAAAKAVDQAQKANVESTPPAPIAVADEPPAMLSVESPPPYAQQRRQARYQEVVALAADGLGPTAIGQRVGLTRQTVARWLRAGSFPARPPSRPRRMLVTPFEPYLRERWQAGCENSRQLRREIQAQGFTGDDETVRRLVVTWRTERGRSGPPRRQPVVDGEPRPAPPPPATRPWSPRQTRWRLLTPADELTPEHQVYLEHLGHHCPEVLVAQRLTMDFLQLVRERDHPAFTPWVAAAAASGLPEFAEFAKGLMRDQAAVEAALQHAWSNGQTEAHVLQLKTLRRQMRGRGGFALGRRRMVKAA